MLLEAKDGFFRELKIESVHQEAIMTKFAQKMEDLAEGNILVSLHLNDGTTTATN